jgi:hypothetical protein
MLGHLCKNGMIRKCKAERCGFCRKRKKKEDSNVAMPSNEIDKFNAHIGTCQREILKDSQSLIKQQSALLDELLDRVHTMTYQQGVLLEVIKRITQAVEAIKIGDNDEAERLVQSTTPLMEEAFVFEKEKEHGEKEEDHKKS